MKKEFGSWKYSFRRTFGRSRGRVQDELYDTKRNKQQEDELREIQALPPDASNSGGSERTEAFFLAPGNDEEKDENTEAGSARNTLAKADCTETEAVSPSTRKSQPLHPDFETSDLHLGSSSSGHPQSTSESCGHNDRHTQRAQSPQQQRQNLGLFRAAIDAGSSILDALDFTISIGSASRFVPTTLPRLRLPPLIASLEIFQPRSEMADASVNVCMSEVSPTFINFQDPPRTIRELDRVCVSNMTLVERKIYHGSLREWRSDLSIASQYRCGARDGGSVASHSITDRSIVRRSAESGGASVLDYDQPSAFQGTLQQGADEPNHTQDVADNLERILDTSRRRQKHGYRKRWATWAGIARSKFTRLCRRQRHESDLSIQSAEPASTGVAIGDDSEDAQWSRHVDALQPKPPQSHIPTQGEFCPSTAAARTQRTEPTACNAGDTDHEGDEEAAPVPPLRITSKRPRTAAENKERLEKLRERLARVPQPGINIAEEGYTNGKQVREQESQGQKTISPQIAASSSLEELLVWTEIIRRREAAKPIATEHRTEASFSNSTQTSSHSSISKEQTSIMSPVEAQVASDRAEPNEWPGRSLQDTKLQALPHRSQEELERVQSMAAFVRRDNNGLPLTQSKYGGVSTASVKHHSIMTIPNSLTSSISQAVDFDSDPRLEDVQNRTRIMGLVHQDWLREAAQQRTAQAPRHTDALSPLSGTVRFLSTSAVQTERDRSQLSTHSQQ